MVLASMCGSRASNGEGSGGTVNATGFSSDCEFELGFLVSASNKPGTAPPAPTSPAPTMPLPAINLRRLMAASSDALTRVRVRANYTAIRLMRVICSPSDQSEAHWPSPHAFHWMRESAQRADSAMTVSTEEESRCSNSLIL